MDHIIVAAVIFVFTYVLISIGRFPGIKIGRGTIALIGGALMLLFGVLPLTDVMDYMNCDVLILLLGMMMLVAGLEFTGFFHVISERLLSGNVTKRGLLLKLMLLSAFLSAIALNDAVVLVFTPVVIRCCRRIGANPIPYLIGLMVSANIGSLATPVGNPQNALIASHAGISFIEFSSYTLPISLVCLPVAFLMIYAMFRRKMDSGMPSDITVEERTDPLRMRLMLIITVGCFLGFILSGYIGVGIHQVAIVAGLLSLLVVCTSSFKDGASIAYRIDWSVLLLFIGLFVIIGGVTESGLLGEIASLFPGFDDSGSVLQLTAFSAVLSNLVSNVPAVALIGGMLPSDTVLWITLAASSTLAGNATLLGSAANMIVAERSGRYGVRIDFWKFMIIGIPVTLVTLFIACAFIFMMA